jgi:4-alpha-glucanotransferase
MNLEKLYQKLNDKKQNGLICPLFFLKTENSSCIGEFPDLKKLADFAKSSGFNIIQLLPIFDTGPECSPYSARTCYGLNPVYLSLKNLEDFDTSEPLYQKLYEKQESHIFDYYNTYTSKIILLKKYVISRLDSFKENEAFKAFQKNNPWLEAYSAFCVLKDKTDLAPEYWDFEIASTILKYQEEALFHQILQYLCHIQFQDAKTYIDSLGLSLMGDIPILLSADSVEMWTHRNLFDFQLTVGAPPDQFSSEGQSWGFPMIRFAAKPQACAQFWRQRIDHLSQYFSYYRIDHAIGFFRLWVIPKGKQAKFGFFFPQDDVTAVANARKLFEQIFRNSPMIPIAEDLGVIPDFVKKFIKDNKIIGTKVVRWERKWDQGGMFIPFNEYEHYSMATLSTHDTSFMFENWKEDPEGSNQLAKLLKIPYCQDYENSTAELLLKKIHECSSLFVINLIHEYLYLHPDFKNKLHRVNNPSIATKLNWSSQMPECIEKLIDDNNFCQKLKSLVKGL